MRCPFCGFEESKVLESRSMPEGMAIRRRRECFECKKRFTTYERIESVATIVVKKNGAREEFNSEKIFRGLLRATEKRNITREKIETVLLEIEREVENGSIKGEIKSTEIGEIVMKNLRKLDEVAYVRFASVYKDFKDLESFIEEIEQIKK